MDELSKQYLSRQNKSNKKIIEKIRTMILSNFSKIKEKGMQEGLWYEGKFYLTSFKDHVNLGVGIVGLSKEESDLFSGKGKTMRHLKFFSLKNVNEKELLKLMKMVYEKTRCECEFN